MHDIYGGIYMSKEYKINLTMEQHKKFERFVMGNDLDFYEDYVINLIDRDQQKFFLENPQFMSELPVSHDKIHLLQDKTFREILRKIVAYEEDRENSIK